MLWVIRYPGKAEERIFCLRTKLHDDPDHGRCLWVEVLGMPEYNYVMPVSVAIDFVDPVGETVDTRLIAERLVAWFMKRDSEEQKQADSAGRSILASLGKTLDHLIQASQHPLD